MSGKLCQAIPMNVVSESVSAERRALIHQAALEAFSERGLAKTSMAQIADVAGMSRPALYQYFKNKEDIFRSMLQTIFADAAVAALAELETPGTVAEQLNGYLQRYHGDLKEQLRAAKHSDEILTFMAENGPTLDADTTCLMHDGLAKYLLEAGASGFGQTADTWLDLLETAPLGFKNDHPTLTVYRQRLTTLATAVAAGLGSS